jgi:hypothetical protein
MRGHRAGGRALLRVARRALRSGSAWTIRERRSCHAVFQVPFPLVIASAAILGILLLPRQAETGGKVAVERTRPFRADLPRLARTTIIGLALWFAPVVLAAWLLGADDLFVAMGQFFAKMAVVTFGGAYAVLTYVAQEVVHHRGWIRSRHDRRPGAGGDHTGTLDPRADIRRVQCRLCRGRGRRRWQAQGAIYVTWITFVPCFLWIFLGAPYMEALRGRRSLDGALAAITAAVVGVIANLAPWFSLHVLFIFHRTRPSALLPDPASLLAIAHSPFWPRWRCCAGASACSRPWGVLSSWDMRSRFSARESDQMRPRARKSRAISGGRSGSRLASRNAIFWSARSGGASSSSRYRQPWKARLGRGSTRTGLGS